MIPFHSFGLNLPICVCRFTDVFTLAVELFTLQILQVLFLFFVFIDRCDS